MKIEHSAYQVPDPRAMADWYVKHLGFSVARAGGEPSYAQFLRDSSGSVMLEVYRNPKVTTPDYWKIDPLVQHVAFLSDDPARDRDRLMAAGAKVAEDLTTTPAGDQILMLRDPWGFAVQLIRRADPMLAC